MCLLGLGSIGTTSGILFFSVWMFERAKNREDVRKEEQKSDWIFARANDRKKFHDLNAAEWHSRKSVNKICTEDEEGDESCENIEQLNLASVNHGKIRSGKEYRTKNNRGETGVKDDSDDIILDQHFSDRKSKKYEHRNKPNYKKYNHHGNNDWDEDDVILSGSESKKASRDNYHNKDKYNSDSFHKRHNHHHQQHRYVHKHHHHSNMKSDDTILGSNFNMDTFLDDFDQGDQDYQQIFV